jgi:alcohol dehydrogenase class IV
MIRPFNFAATPECFFGAGKIEVLPSLVRRYGRKVLLVTGANASWAAPSLRKAIEELSHTGTVDHVRITREPSPAMIDDIVLNDTYSGVSVVVAIGGGSVLDAGKAISAMLPLREPVKHYLEGVGTKNHPGVKVAFIAIPTTAGTGSEATKNAVLSEVGPNGFKRSLRHNNFVPDATIIDAVLSVNCPPWVTAASGMDAFTQLLESYLSTTANALTDALALEGLQRISRSLLKAYSEGGDIEARSDMALAAYLSGITLANAGLGTIHGFASSIAARVDVPHGVVCSRMMFPVNAITIRKLRNENDGDPALAKYATVGQLFSSLKGRSQEYYVDLLLETIGTMSERMQIPSLSTYGLTSDLTQKIAQETENKNNPVKLSTEELEESLMIAL